MPAFGSPVPIFAIPAAATSFGLLGGSVSDTGTSVVEGNVGATSTITGFPPGTETGFACTPVPPLVRLGMTRLLQRHTTPFSAPEARSGRSQ
jgi:hypothetical protein